MDQISELQQKPELLLQPELREKLEEEIKPATRRSFLPSASFIVRKSSHTAEDKYQALGFKTNSGVSHFQILEQHKHFH